MQVIPGEEVASQYHTAVCDLMLKSKVVKNSHVPKKKSLGNWRKKDIQEDFEAEFCAAQDPFAGECVENLGESVMKDQLKATEKTWLDQRSPTAQSNMLVGTMM